jgi:uncharacterized membrane protein YiaA
MIRRRVITTVYVLTAGALVASVALWAAVLVIGCWGVALAVLVTGEAKR